MVQMEEMQNQKKIEFNDAICITKYVLNSREHIKYKIICVCVLLDGENKNKNILFLLARIKLIIIGINLMTHFPVNVIINRFMMDLYIYYFM